MTIWHFQRQVSARLLSWAGFSIVVGWLMRRGGRFWRGAGGQFIGWGIINALIALGGRFTTEQRIATLDNPGQPDVLDKETRNLRGLLWVNAGLDVLYILGGWWMMRRDKGEGTARGSGWGVIIQGGFLLVFDMLHALLLSKRDER